MALEIKPTEGKVALQLLEEDEEDAAQAATPPPGAGGDSDYNKTIYAIVLGVGPNVKGIKKGSTVLVREYVRNDPRVEDDVVLSESWAVLATVS